MNKNHRVNLMSGDKLMKHKIAGFTLIELMITIALAGILAAIGLPSFTDTISRSRLTTNINELVASMNFARSEAVKQNRSITVRKSGTEWEEGWTIFVDMNGDGVYDADGVDNTLGTADDETELRIHEALPSHFTLRSTGINRVTYRASGQSGNGSFVLCDNKDGNNAPEAWTSRLMIINAVGRVRMGADNDNDGIPEKNDGTEITSCITSPFT